MNNGYNEYLDDKVAERSERAKKLYRYVTDVARRVGESTATCGSLTDLFSTHLEIQRQKLRDNCEKLLFLNPLEYGKKSLELLWRKVYYDTVSIAKKLKETDAENDSYLFSHIVCGIGHFHHFIQRIQSEMKVTFKELDYIPFHEDEEAHDVEEMLSDETLQFGRTALHSCLIYLGDLSRYQTELFHIFEPSIAARYYLQAAHIDMASGMPYNQLGNLYLDKNYNLDSVCYYIQCMGCKMPFEGAMDNISKIFEKNLQYYETLNDSESLTRAEHIQNTIVNFLSLIELWYFSKNDTNIPQRCSEIARELKVAMDFDQPILPDINKNYDEYVHAIEEENSAPSYLNGNLVHKIVQICLFTISKTSESDEGKAFACKAFTLALLSQLLQKLQKQIESVGLKNPAIKYYEKFSKLKNKELNSSDQDIESKSKENIAECETLNGSKNIVSEETAKEEAEDESDKLQNAETKNKKIVAKRRRRRRVASSESSELSDAETESSEVETFDTCSDDDNMSDSTYQSDDDSSSNHSYDDGSDDEVKEKQVNGDHHNTPNSKSDDINSSTVKENIASIEKVLNDTNCNNNNKLNIPELQNFMLGNNYLPSIKLLLDWALTEKDLILSCGDSGEVLFQCVADLLNIFNYYFNPKSNNISDDQDYKIVHYSKNIAKKLKLEYKTVPLPEDINLRGSNICKFDKDAAEWQILDRYRPSVYEETVIRIMNFIDFGTQIAKIVPRIRFNRSLKIFYLKKVVAPKLNTKINHKRSREWHNSKKPHVGGGGGGAEEGGLLRRLGRLWLAGRVRELERSGRAPPPAVLALDAAALLRHLRRVKLLLRARYFLLLVPAIVLKELDKLKREQSAARDAIRWLELQLKSGSRHLRAQRPGQSKPLPLLKYPRKAPTHIHNFIQILEYCHFFISDEKQSQGGNGDPDNSLQGKSTPLLILLVGNEPGKDNEEEQYKEFSVTGAAQAAGISVEYIGNFYTNWRRSVHKNSKKR